MKKLLILVVVVIVAAAGAFYGGMTYAKSKSVKNLSRVNFQTGAAGAGMGRLGNRTDSGFASGDIISKDENSITVKLRDGGSKIVFYSDKAEIGKFVTGTLSDLNVGENVVVNGTANQDGSLTAQSIQIRPTPMPAPANQ